MQASPVNQSSLLIGGLAFVAGALATATVSAIVARFFDRARLRFAITAVRTTRTQNQQHKVLRLTPVARRLLSDSQLQLLDWDHFFFAEQALDYSLLELIEQEEVLKATRDDLRAVASDLGSRAATDVVSDFARNKVALIQVSNALKMEQLPSPLPDRKAFTNPGPFPLIITSFTQDGSSRERIQLALPGALAPIVGDPEGRPFLNERVWPLAYALSTCDVPLLKRVIEHTCHHIEHDLARNLQLRDVLQRIKDDRRYLQVIVTVANIGKESAFLSETATVGVAGGSPIKLRYRAFDPAADRQQTDVILADFALRLAQAFGVDAKRMADYTSLLARIPIAAGGSAQLTYVSEEPLSEEQRQAIAALATGYVDCRLALTTYRATTAGLLRFVQRHSRTVVRVQKLTQLG